MPALFLDTAGRGRSAAHGPHARRRYDEVKRATVYEPFQKATGIEIVPVAATVAKLLAMHRSGQMEVDRDRHGRRRAAAARPGRRARALDLKKFKRTNPDDIEATVKHKAFVGSFNYAMLMGYHTGRLSKGQGAEVVGRVLGHQAFPGPRTLAEHGKRRPDLEFALLADGVAMDKLYPLDIPRAFKSLSRVRPAITKFWDTGALSAQMLADKEVVLAALWSTRLGVAIDKGAPLGAQWNQNAVLGQAYGIPKGSKAGEAAFAFIDFSLEPGDPGGVAGRPTRPYRSTRRPTPATSPELMDPETKVPWTKSKGYVRDIVWWSENRTKVNAAWSKWLAQ